MFYQICLSLQVKRCAIVTYKHGIYKLPLELPNDLRIWIVGTIRKVSKPHRMIAQRPAPPAKMKLAENFRKTEIKLFPLRVISHEN